MGYEVATAWVRIVPTVSGIQGAIAQQMAPAAAIAETEGTKAGNRFTSGVKGALTGTTAAIVGAFAVKAVINGIQTSVAAARDLNEAGTAVGAVFGSSFSTVEKWSQKSADLLGQSQLQALNAAKTFGIYGQSAGLAGAENVKFATSMTGLATDLASFHNTSPEEAILAIGAALRGENEPIRRFGVLLDDATLRNEALRLGLISTTKDALTPQQKVLAAQSAIMAQTSVAQGDFARTSGGLANQQRILDANLANLAATVGQMLIPAFGAITGAIIPLVGYLAKNQAVVIGLAVAVGATLVAAFIAWTASIWASTVALLANPVTWVVVGIMALIGAIILIATKTTFFQTIWESMTKGVAAVWTWLWGNVLKPVFDAIGAIFGWLWNNIIQPIVNGIVTYVKIWAAIYTWLWENILKPVFDQIGKVFDWVYKNVIIPVILGIQLYVKMWGAIFTWLWTSILQPTFDAIGKIVNWVWTSVIKPVVDFIVGAMSKWHAATKTSGDIINGIFSGIGSAANTVRDIIKSAMDIAGGAVDGAVRIFTGAATKVREAFQGIGKFIQDSFGGAGKFIGDIVKNIFGDVSGDWRGQLIGGNIGGKTMSRVQRAMPAGLRITSGYRTPAQNRAVGGAHNSLHQDRNNPAVDIAGPTASLDRFAMVLRSMGGWRQLLWRVPGHFDHIHVAHQGGVVSSSWPRSIGDKPDERTARLRVGELVVPADQFEAWRRSQMNRADIVPVSTNQGPTYMEGELVLDSGEFMGTIRGEIRKKDEEDEMTTRGGKW